MIEARALATATLLRDGQVLVTGGLDASGFVLATAELYDPVAGTWNQTGIMALGRSQHTATLLDDGTVLVVGGDDGRGPLPSAERYDPDTQSWRSAGMMAAARASGYTATLLSDGTVLVAGGYRTGREPWETLASAELYHPGNGTWTDAGATNTGRNGHTATRLSDERVLVAGGGGPLTSAELYDPETGTWTDATSTVGGRIFHTATLLPPTGWVLVTGGMDGTGSLAVAELYDPIGGTWALTQSMLESRLGHLAVLLPDGRVLVLGGVDSVIDGGNLLMSAELFGLGGG
jgi:hypothetical protein